jgi:hypothetical protein
MLQAYIHYHSGTLSSFSYAYHMRLIVQQTAILPELKHVNLPYPDYVPEQCKKWHIITHGYQCLTQLHRDHCRMVVEFTTNSAYYHKVVSSNPVHGEVYSIQHYVIKWTCDRFVVFPRYSTHSSTNKSGFHDI